MRLVLDTNVWLDWLVFDDAGVSALRQAVTTGRAAIYIDAACRAELARVLAYPLAGTVLDAEAQAAHLAMASSIVRVLDRADPAREPGHVGTLPTCRDRDDQKFLELARDCKACALVTKDNALLELAHRERRPLPFDIVKPADLII